MKSVKYKFSSDITADCVARHYLLELYFLRPNKKTNKYSLKWKAS